MNVHEEQFLALTVFIRDSLNEVLGERHRYSPWILPCFVPNKANILPYVLEYVLHWPFPFLSFTCAFSDQVPGSLEFKCWEVMIWEIQKRVQFIINSNRQWDRCIFLSKDLTWKQRDMLMHKPVLRKRPVCKLEILACKQLFKNFKSVGICGASALHLIERDDTIPNGLKVIIHRDFYVEMNQNYFRQNAGTKLMKRGRISHYPFQLDVLYCKKSPIERA